MPADEQHAVNIAASVVEKTVTRSDGGTAACQFVRHIGSVAILPILTTAAYA